MKRLRMPRWFRSYQQKRRLPYLRQSFLAKIREDLLAYQAGLISKDVYSRAIDRNVKIFERESGLKISDERAFGKNWKVMVVG